MAQGRVAPRLIWHGDFVATAQAGGKGVVASGGGGGKGGRAGAATSYN